MFDTLLHKYLNIPYSLHVRHNQRPKNAKATIVLLHGIGNSGEAWNKVVSKLPDDYHLISIDLLGFGNSPRPSWAKYNVTTQARSVLKTLLPLVKPGKVVVAGHSLGGLVAIEAAKRYPLFIRSLVLCSPPIYRDDVTRNLPKTDVLLRSIYRSVLERPSEFSRLSAFATKYKLVNDTFTVTPENLDSYMATLEAAIIDQTAYHDALTLKVPTIILRGLFDPFVINRNLKELSRKNIRIELRTVPAGHELAGAYIPAVVAAIEEAATVSRNYKV